MKKCKDCNVEMIDSAKIFESGGVMNQAIYLFSL